MKKIYTLILCASIGFSASAQNKIAGNIHNAGPVNNLNTLVDASAKTAATGDTLIHFQGSKLMNASISNIDVANFDVFTAKLNTGATQYGANLPAGYNFSYNVIAVGDTERFMLATSWYTTAGAANNHFVFGPMIIPVGGATLVYEDSFIDPGFRDGFKIKVATTKPSSGNSYAGTTILTVADNATSTVADTSYDITKFYQHTLVIPATYNGQTIWFDVNHTGNDQNIISFSDIVLMSTSFVLGAKEVASAKNLSVYPNPSNGQFNIDMPNASNVTVYNVLGSVVYSTKLNAGINTINVNNLSDGVYFVKSTVNGETIVKQIVINK